MYDLGENKGKPYDQFIEKLLRQHNEIAEREESLHLAKFNKIVYRGTDINIIIPSLDDEEGEKHSFHNENGFTTGQLLYEIAKFIPDDDNIENIFGNHVYFEGLRQDDNDSNTYELSLGS